jgi:hypothetical protein
MQHLVKPIGYKHNKRNETWFGNNCYNVCPYNFENSPSLQKIMFLLIGIISQKNPHLGFFTPLFNLTKVSLWTNQFQHSLFDQWVMGHFD